MQYLKQILKYAGALSALVALVSLVVTLMKINNELEDKRLSDWQDVAVFTVIEKASPHGIAWSELHKAYVGDAQVYEKFNVPKSRLQEPELKRVLLRLIQSRAVTVDKVGNYRLFSLPEMPSMPEALARMEALRPVFMAIPGILASESANLKPPQLYDRLQQKFPEAHLTFGEFLSMLSEMVAAQQLRFAPDGSILPFFHQEPNPLQQP